MNKPILEIENISKLYNIHGRQENYMSFRDSIKGMLKRNPKEDFWALKDISFKVEAGDSVGIMGKNGAGKSTLLKILSRITPPTTGRITSRGRIASLLEVGTGFHGELSGRENVFMNGSILGMRKQEILKNFDAIVDFAGVDQFIDTPLKHYSSGMQLRLAFAVAAFLENEILIIDEVLAVGDSEFQKKCMGKMQDVSSSGRTVLFVSHNIAAVKSLCNKGVVLQKGKKIFDGQIQKAVSFYQSSLSGENPLIKEYTLEDGYFNSNISLTKIKLSPKNADHITVTSGCDVEIHFKNLVENINLDCTIELRSIDDTVVFHTGALISQNNNSKIGDYIVAFNLESFYLNAGRYSISLIFGKNQREVLFHVDSCYYFDIDNDVSLGNNSSVLPGILRPNFNFNISFNE